MTLGQFVTYFDARRTGKDRYMAFCPAHPDRNRSLSIDRGKDHAFVFECMSQHCNRTEIIKAVGLTWKDIHGTPDPKVKRKITDGEILRKMRAKRDQFILNQYFQDWQHARFWHEKELKIAAEIDALERKMEPEKDRQRKIYAALERFGVDRVWEKFLQTEKGQQLNQKYGIDFNPSITSGESPSPRLDSFSSGLSEKNSGDSETDAPALPTTSEMPVHLRIQRLSLLFGQ